MPLDNLIFYHPIPVIGKKFSAQLTSMRENSDTLSVLVRAAVADIHTNLSDDSDNDLAGWELGELDFHNRFRLFYDKDDDEFKIQFNTGTEAAPVWVDQFRIRQGDGKVIAPFGFEPQSSVFYGVDFTETGPDPGRTTFRSDTLRFDETFFYITTSSDGKPIASIILSSFPGAAGGEANTASNLGTGEGVFGSKAGVDLRFKSLIGGTNVTLSSTSTEITIDSTAAGGTGFYGITAKHTDDSATFSGLNVLAFNVSDFYLTQNDPNTDEVIISSRGGAQGAQGPKGDTGDTGAQGEAGAGFYGITAQHTDDSVTFSGLEVFNFNVDGFYLTQNDPNTDEVIINLRQVKGDKGDTGDTGATGATGAQGEAGAGFYGITAQHTDGSVTFSGLEVLNFNVDGFYLTQNDPNTDEVIINLRQVKGDKGDTGDTGATGATGAQGEQGPGFYLTVKHTDDTQSFSDLNIIAFNTDDFYVTQNDPNTDEVIVNFKGDKTVVEAGDNVTVAQSGDTWTVAADVATSDIGPGFYGVTVKQSDDTATFSGIEVLSFETASFYLTQNDPNTDEVQINFRGTAGGGVTDHGALTGLADDDHTQYTLADGTRAFTGNQSMGSNKLTSLGAPTADDDAARLQDIPPGFYGITTKHTDDSVSFSGIDLLAFNSDSFYLTQNDPNTDEVQINLKGGGAQGPEGPEGPTGPAGAGFYGITAKHTDDSVSFSGLNVFNFNVDGFYLTQNDPNTDEVIVNLRQVKGDKGDTGDTGATGATGAQGEQGPGFYLTVKHSDDTQSFGDLNIIAFNTDDFYVTQNDPNTDEVIVNFKGDKTVVEAGANVTVTQSDDTWTVAADVATSDIGPGFYGITAKHTDDSVSFSGLEVFNFNIDGFYLTQNDPNTDEVIVNLRQVKGDKGDTGDTGATGATGAQGEAGAGFYLTVKHSDDTQSFSDLNVIAFNVDDFYVTQNDPNTDEVVVNFKGDKTVVEAGANVTVAQSGDTWTVAADVATSDIGPGFYGVTAKLTDDSASFSGLEVFDFHVDDFYLTQNDPNTDEVIINLRQNKGDKGDTGDTGATGAQGEQGPGFYLTVKHSDDTQSFSDLNIIAFNVDDFYVTQNDPNTDEVQINFRGTAGGGATDHGALTGLADDDHTQYTLADGTRAFTGDQSMGSNKLTSLGAPTADDDAARLQDIGPGFYGITAKHTDDSASFSGLNTLAFNVDQFYLTQNDPNTDEAIINLKQDALDVPAGSNRQVQYNDGGTLAGASNFEYDKDTEQVRIPDGTVDAPGIAFRGNTGLGIFSGPRDGFYLAADGVILAEFNSGSGDGTGEERRTTFNTQIRVFDGTVNTAPAIAFDERGTGATGIIRPTGAEGNGQLNLISSGAVSAKWGVTETSSESGIVSGGTGSAALPTFTFNNPADKDTGMFRVAANELGFAVGGNLEAHLTRDKLQLFGGFYTTFGEPVYSLTAGTDITITETGVGTFTIDSTASVSASTPGFYGITAKHTDDSVTFSGLEVLAFNVNDFYLTQNDPNTDEVIINLRDEIPAGTSGQIQFNNNGALGGATNFEYDVANDKVLIPDGDSSADPGIAFIGETNTGFSLAASSVVIIGGGALAAQLSPSEARLVGNVRHAGTSSASTPSYAFSNDSDTGMFRVAANELGFAVGGNEQVSITRDKVQLQGGFYTFFGEPIYDHKFTKSITIETPTATENITMFFTPVDITIDRGTALIRGGTSVTVDFYHSTDRTAGHGNRILSSSGEEVISNKTTGQELDVTGDTTVPKNSWIWITSSALSGVVNELSVTFVATED